MTKSAVLAPDGIDPLMYHLKRYELFLFPLDPVMTLVITVYVHPER